MPLRNGFPSFTQHKGRFATKLDAESPNRLIALIMVIETGVIDRFKIRKK